MTEDIENRIGEIPKVDSITVETVADKVWTQNRMTEEAYEERKQYFQERSQNTDSHRRTMGNNG